MNNQIHENYLNMLENYENMFLYDMLYFLNLIICIFTKYNIYIPEWKSKSKPEKISQYKSILDYLDIGNCQSIENNCLELPNYPNKRAYHTSITYKTYSQKQSNELCPSNKCGPFCNYTSNDCLLENNYNGYPVPTNLELINFSPASSPHCPEDCCSSDNEYCFRLINNAGNEVMPDQEMMLVFGGLVLNKIKFEINNETKNVYENCDEIIEGLENMNSSNLNDNQNLNLLYLINNCGYDMTNELWEYNIRNDNWNYIKPYVDINNENQQKPYPRYGHAGVYIEKFDTSNNFIRKYLIIYGGYSLYCKHSCDDMWSYEISYGPQRFYPKSNNGVWEKGNKWKRIYPSSDTPGKRALHSITVDSEFKYIYLFGGYSIDENLDQNILMDDLWRYNILENKWSKLNTKGINSISRIITYWNGSSTTINISPQNYNEDIDTVNMILKSDIADNSNFHSFPIKRAATSLVYNTRKDGSEFLLLFGGLTYNDTNSYHIQYILNDLWIYNITDNSWFEIFSKDEKPDSRYGHQIIALKNDNFLLYGGVGSGQFYSEIWIFKIWPNIWANLTMKSETIYSSAKNNWPYPSAFFTMNYFKDGIIIYGGLIWKHKLKQYNYFNEYTDEEEHLLDYSLFNTLENLYLLESNQCENSCNNNGFCYFGICICNENFWGNNCENNLCPNSFCFFEDDFHIIKECFHCSGNGECLESGKCSCNQDYTGDDCSIMKCLNNCSGEPFGKCIIKKPVSQCECNEELKRGGDDCSLIFCLNNCGIEGICNRDNGECECPKTNYGIDCSVYVIDFREKNNFINRYKIYQIYLISKNIIFLI